MKRTGPTNIYLRKLIRELKKLKKPFYRKLAEELGKPRRKRICVNISKINKLTRPGERVVIPGKVLGYGFLDHPVKVFAWRFSKKAIEKIKEAGGETLELNELIKEKTYPKIIK